MSEQSTFQSLITISIFPLIGTYSPNRVVLLHFALFAVPYQRLGLGYILFLEVLIWYQYLVTISTLGSERKKKRKSRWGTEEKRTFIPGMPTNMPPNLSPDQQKAYIGKFWHHLSSVLKSNF